MRKSFAVLPLIALLAVGCSEAPTSVEPNAHASDPSFSVHTTAEWSLGFADNRQPNVLDVGAYKNDGNVTGEGRFYAGNVSGSLSITGAADAPCDANNSVILTGTASVGSTTPDFTLTINESGVAYLAIDGASSSLEFRGKYRAQCSPLR